MSMYELPAACGTSTGITHQVPHLDLLIARTRGKALSIEVEGKVVDHISMGGCECGKLHPKKA